MLMRRSVLLLVPLLMSVVACSSSAQAPRDAESLRREIDALKAQQGEIQKSLEEVREFLRAASGGRFGGPSIVGSTFDLGGVPSAGRAAAPVTIVEISDYHCPFCRRHVQQTQPQIYADYVQTGKARHLFVHYPIAQLHPDAHLSHEAAACAGDQGKFWELHARLFDQPAKTVEQLTALAPSIGLDAAALRSCLDSGTHRAAIKASVERIQQLNISGTPMFLIGRTPTGAQAMTVSKLIEGAQPFSAFKTAIDEVAAGQ